MQFICDRCSKGIYNISFVKMTKQGLACSKCGHRKVKFLYTKRAVHGV